MTTEVPAIVMKCKTCGQEDGRSTEALLRADLVEARREIERMESALRTLDEWMDKARVWDDARVLIAKALTDDH